MSLLDKLRVGVLGLSLYAASCGSGSSTVNNGNEIKGSHLIYNSLCDDFYDMCRADNYSEEKSLALKSECESLCFEYSHIPEAMESCSQLYCNVQLNYCNDDTEHTPTEIREDTRQCMDQFGYIPVFDKENP
jgi:hypothetical protein